jgi:hypothetical protein
MKKNKTTAPRRPAQLGLIAPLGGAVKVRWQSSLACTPRVGQASRARKMETVAAAGHAAGLQRRIARQTCRPTPAADGDRINAVTIAEQAAFFDCTQAPA